jgi:RanGTP-binding protein
MEPLLASLTQQAMNYAIRSGIAITTTYALKQSSRLLSRVEDSVPEREELRSLRDQLEGKIRILGPAIDLVELM